MAAVQNQSLLLIFIGTLLLQFRLLYSQNLDCHSNDYLALKKFINGLESPIHGWNASASCCDWHGVVCNSSSYLGLAGPPDSGRVVGLLLGSKKLHGRLSDSLGQLEQLRVLNFSNNRLREEPPPSIFHLQHLEVLDLSCNRFSGLLSGRFDLPSVKILDLSRNSFSGSLPAGICGNASAIRYLDLSANYFTGPIPSGLGNCGSLEELIIGTNELSGNISPDIFRLRQLVRLDLSVNKFSGEIPNLFQNLSRLQFLIAYSNNFNGRIPSSLSDSRSLVFLNLRNNSIGGEIALNCSAMSSLESLDLASNDFVGPMPNNLPDCRRLTNVNLAKNNFRGQIPDSFRNFHSLAYLSLSNCSLYNVSSALNILQHCTNLTYLVLTWNFYNEQFPSDQSLDFPKLRVLIIPNCQLSGSVPQWTTKSSNLQLLDLSWNKLSGSIPPWLGTFQSLFYLDLSNNSFSGPIPREITDLQSLIDRVGVLQDPSPDFPIFMKKNVSLRGYQYNQVWSFPPTVNLGYNSLSGPIWPEFGKLKRLHNLYLKNNSLSGPIPEELSGMTSLETLDLSCNNLSGTLPSSLANLNFLATFSVAYNHLLHGPIPTGTQFATFPNSSFEGTHLFHDHVQSNRSGTFMILSDRSKSRRLVAGMVVGLGLVTGIVIATITFFIVRRVRRRGEVKDEGLYGSRGLKDVEKSGSTTLLVIFQENDKQMTYDDIVKATHNFDQENIIGCGGFGIVYRAILPNGRKLAIKKLSGDCGQMEREFRAEVETLSRAQHPNLVLLEGYCINGDARLLIYSYMANNSLDYWLHENPTGPASLDWKKRIGIAQGASRGLAYLHQSCDPHIVHRDVKSSNILLDANFTAHLADFGLARLISAFDSHVTTDLVGTLGYIPPEYGQASVATYKGDVYSFGVVLLELLTGKTPMDVWRPKGSTDLISWVLEMKKEKKACEVFDPLIYGKQHDMELMRVLEIACDCLNENPKERPSTHLLVSSLENVAHCSLV